MPFNCLVHVMCEGFFNLFFDSLGQGADLQNVKVIMSCSPTKNYLKRIPLQPAVKYTFIYT